MFRFVRTNAALIFATFVSGTLIAGTIIASQFVEPTVYVSPKDGYYYHELCVRARSHKLNESSPRYFESTARRLGYEPVPEELKDFTADISLDDLREISRLLLTYYQIEDLERFTREFILRTCENPSRIGLHSFEWRPGPSPDNYIVQWSSNRGLEYELEVFLRDDKWDIVYIDTIDLNAKNTPAYETAQEKQAPRPDPIPETWQSQLPTPPPPARKPNPWANRGAPIPRINIAPITDPNGNTLEY